MMKQAPTASTVAAAGTTTLPTAGQRIATTTAPATATTIWAFACRGYSIVRRNAFTDLYPELKALTSSSFQSTKWAKRKLSGNYAVYLPGSTFNSIVGRG